MHVKTMYIILLLLIVVIIVFNQNVSNDVGKTLGAITITLKAFK